MGGILGRRCGLGMQVVEAKFSIWHNNGGYVSLWQHMMPRAHSHQKDKTLTQKAPNESSTWVAYLK